MFRLLAQYNGAKEGMYMPESVSVPLCALGDGERGEIESVAVEGRLQRRLLEMGATPGTRVGVVKRAPLGDPMEVGLRGYALALREDIARGIAVRRRKDLV